MFENLIAPPIDALHGVMAKCAADTRTEKIDLGVGVYRNKAGHAPIFNAVKQAEKLLIETEDSKAYLGLHGNTAFLEQMQYFAFGASVEDRTAKIQSVGGTGGLRLAIELAKHANPDLRVFVGMPTWPNHLTICEMLGVEAVTYDYFDKYTQSLTFDRLLTALSMARRGDVAILHGPCHNPTGMDLSDAQFRAVLSLLNERGAIPLIDAAYYGLGNTLEVDMNSISHIVSAVPTAMIVLSCSKAFGLYRERTGALFVTSPSAKLTPKIQGTLERIARGNYSMPPSHGGAIVATILSDPSLRKDWNRELGEMRIRVASLRADLIKTSEGDPRLEAIGVQKGIFSLLPLSSDQVQWMADEQAIYMPASGRINIAGLKDGDVERFCAAISRLDVSALAGV